MIEGALIPGRVAPRAFYFDNIGTEVAEYPDSNKVGVFVGEYGIITMALSYGFAIVLPIVGTFFIIFSVLEDSGYLPRQ